LDPVQCVVQEESDSLYQLGPAPVAAVRNGEVRRLTLSLGIRSLQVGLGYDTAFVFTEVNADVVVYVQDPSSAWGFRRTDRNMVHVGQRLVTKAIGDPRGQVALLLLLLSTASSSPSSSSSSFPRTGRTSRTCTRGRRGPRRRGGRWRTLSGDADLAPPGSLSRPPSRGTSRWRSGASTPSDEVH
jgi:hypothetical protein